MSLEGLWVKTTVLSDLQLRFKLEFKSDEKLRGLSIDLDRVAVTIGQFARMMQELEAAARKYRDFELLGFELTRQEIAALQVIEWGAGCGMKGLESTLFFLKRKLRTICHGGDGPQQRKIKSTVPRLG